MSPISQMELLKKLEATEEELMAHPQRSAILFLKPPTATTRRVRSTIDSYLRGHGFWKNGEILLPNSLAVWKALYPHFDDQLIKLLHELSKNSYEGPQLRVLKTLLGFDDANYFILYLLKRSTAEVIGKKPATNGEIAQSILKELQGRADHLKPSVARISRSLRARITMLLSDKLRQEQLDPNNLLPIKVEAPLEGYYALDGYVHVPDSNDTIATLKRLKQVLLGSTQDKD